LLTLLTLSCEKDNAYSITVVLVSVFLVLVGIRILISSFDNDDNYDGDGMADLTWDIYQFSSLEG